MVDAVIFDLFGTLIRLPSDTHPYKRLSRAMKDSSCVRESLVIDAPTLADFCDQMGVTHPVDLKDIQRDLDRDVDNATVFDDALPTLQAVRDLGLRVALISSLASPYKRVVTRLALDDFFDVIMYSCDIGIAKPHRDVYREALTRLGSSPESNVMVGDSHRSDVEGLMACAICGLLLDRDGKYSGETVLRTLSSISSRLNS